MDPMDEEAQMAAMMGFSSFAAPAESNASKKRKTSDTHYGTTQQQPGERPDIGSGAAHGNSNYLPIGQRRERPVATTNAPDQSPTENADSETTTDGAHPVLKKTLEELTSDDLYALRKGVRDADGRTVFFQPSFIEEDPWARLKDNNK